MRRRPLLVVATIALIAVGLPRYSLAVPTESRGGSCDAKLPPPRLLVAGRADVGGDWRYFGFCVGSMMFQRWSEADATGPVPSFLPTASEAWPRRRSSSRRRARFSSF